MPHFMSFAAGRAAAARARPCDLLPALLQSSPQHPSADRPHQHLRPPRDQGAGLPPPRTAATSSLPAPGTRRPPASMSVSVSASLIRLARICVARSSSGPSLGTKTHGSRSRDPRSARSTTRCANPFSSLPFLLCETEHPNPT